MTSTLTSHDLALPAGAAAGDDAFIFVGGGFSIQTPSGWERIVHNFPASGWNCAILRKTLTAGDITAGNIALTFDGGYTHTLDIVCFNGRAYLRTFKLVSSLTSGSVNGVAHALPLDLITNDIVIAVGTGRGNSPSLAITPGTSIQFEASSLGSMRAYRETALSAGPVSYTPSNIVSSFEYAFMAVGVTLGAPVFTVAPTITSASGFYAVGDTLAAVPGTHNGTSYTWQWQRDGVDIGGATSVNYTLVAGDKTHVITVDQIAAFDLATARGSSAPTITIADPVFSTVGNRKTSDGSDRLTSTGDTRVTTIRTS